MDTFDQVRLDMPDKGLEYLVQKLFTDREAGTLIMIGSMELKEMKMRSPDVMQEQIKALVSALAKLITGLPKNYRDITLKLLKEQCGIIIASDS